MRNGQAFQVEKYSFLQNMEHDFTARFVIIILLFNKITITIDYLNIILFLKLTNIPAYLWYSEQDH